MGAGSEPIMLSTVCGRTISRLSSTVALIVESAGLVLVLVLVLGLGLVLVLGLTARRRRPTCAALLPYPLPISAHAALASPEKGGYTGNAAARGGN